jgi:hypothetical protein
MQIFLSRESAGLHGKDVAFSEIAAITTSGSAKCAGTGNRSFGCNSSGEYESDVEAGPIGPANATRSIVQNRGAISDVS